jgi:hypothetical protein
VHRHAACNIPGVSDDNFDVMLAQLDEALDGTSVNVPQYALEDLLMTGEDPSTQMPTAPPPPERQATRWVASTTSAALMAGVMGFGVGLGAALAVVVFRDRVVAILGLW